MNNEANTFKIFIKQFEKYTLGRTNGLNDIVKAVFYFSQFLKLHLKQIEVHFGSGTMRFIAQ